MDCVEDFAGCAVEEDRGLRDLGLVDARLDARCTVLL